MSRAGFEPASPRHKFGRDIHYTIFIDDLFSVNNDNFGNCIRQIYPSELDTTLNSTEVCYLDTKIGHGDSSAPFHINGYDNLYIQDGLFTQTP